MATVMKSTTSWNVNSMEVIVSWPLIPFVNTNIGMMTGIVILKITYTNAIGMVGIVVLHIQMKIGISIAKPLM